MAVKDRLRAETDTWTGRFDDRIDAVSATADGKRLLENARAYRDDTEHFIAEEDWVRAFEAIVWAWSWLEIGKELDVLR